MNHWDVLRKY